MSHQNLQVRSGNRIEVTFDGIKVGLLQSVRMSDDYSPEAASGIGDIHAIEYVPTMARHTISVQSMVLKKSSLRKAGIATLNGDSALQGLVFDITSYSKDDGTLLRKYTSCTYASGDVEIGKHSIVMSSGQFMALDVTGSAM